MGQQQLLLLVLGIVIVGLAIVVGINAFDEGRIKSNGDALVSDGLRIASDAQAWALKPIETGGGGGAVALSSLGGERGFGGGGFAKLGYPSPEGSESNYYLNPNGIFFFSTSDACGSEITIPSGKTPLVYLMAADIIKGKVDFNDIDVVVCIGIAGTHADDIGTIVRYDIPTGEEPT